MKKVDWTKKSRQRAAIWAVVGVVATVFAWFGKDATIVLSIGSAVAGGFGLLVSD